MTEISNLDKILVEISKIEDITCDKHQDQEVTHMITETLDENLLCQPVCILCQQNYQSTSSLSVRRGFAKEFKKFFKKFTKILDRY